MSTGDQAPGLAPSPRVEWKRLRSGWWSACSACRRDLVKVEGGTPQVGTPAALPNAGNSGPVSSVVSEPGSY